MSRNHRHKPGRPSPQQPRAGLRSFFAGKPAARQPLNLPKANVPPPGTSPGIIIGDLPAEPAGENMAVSITCVDSSPEQVQIQEVPELADFLASHRPSWSKVRWINVVGGHRAEVVGPLAEKYQLHPLAIEDLVHGDHRPKVEDYPASGDAPGRLFIVARLVHLQGESLHSEQSSIFLGRNTLLTFLETQNGVFDSIYRRIRVSGSRLRHNDASFLCYSLLDAIVDSYFPALEYYSTRIEETEEELLHAPSQSTLQKAHAVKRGLLLLRRAVWPMRELVAQLQRDRHECLSETTLTYFRDVYDHCVQIIDLNETYHEIATSLTETYMSVISNRMNEVMKVLTVISTIFIPLTFLAGVYGMNMPIPENKWSISYPIFWLTCSVIAFFMLLWFRRRDWI
jgi:magnesium transporter